MPMEIARQNVATANLDSPVGVEVMDDVKGHYRGQIVQVTPAPSKLIEEAEEVGMAVASRADRRSLGQRDVRAGRGNSAEALARAKGKFDDLPDLPGDAQITSLVERFGSLETLLSSAGGGGGGEPTAEDVLEALNGYDSDVTHQFAALEILRAHAEATDADPRLLALLDQARATFDRADVMRDVRAGRAAAAVASQAAATLETDPASVREAYRSMVRDTKSLGQVFDGLRRFDLLKSFDDVMDTFTTAAGRDLASTGPSSDPALLGALLSELGKLKRLRTAFEAMRQLVATTERGLPRHQRGGIDAVDQASRLFHFASAATAGPADARRLMGAFDSRPLPQQIVFGNGIRILHADLADDVMPSPQARLQQGAAILKLLDGLVAEDERAFATQEHG